MKKGGIWNYLGDRMPVFIEVKRGAITLRDASTELCISYRHAKRLYKRFKKEGIWGLMPKKRKQEPWNKTRVEVKARIIALKRDYPFLNLSHITDLLKEESIHISREKDNTFPYNSRNFQLSGTVGRTNLSGAKVELHIISKRRIRVFLEGRFFQEFPYDGE